MPCLPGTGELKKICEDIPAPKRVKIASPAKTIDQPDYVKLQCYLEYSKYLQSVYKRVLRPDNQTKWPRLKIHKAINLACIKQEPYDPFQVDDFTKSTIHGNVDDVLKHKEQIELQKVACLQEDNSFHECVLVTGAPGVGKTTLAQMLCLGWIEKTLLKWYSLVVMLRLREARVQSASQIEDLFYYSNKAVQQAISREIEAAQGSHVLLILEGFDELPQVLQSSGFLMDLINGKCLAEATKLITSRHSATSVLQINARVTQHVEVLGFTKTNIEQYIVSVLNTGTCLFRNFEKYLSRYGFIKSMMYIPLHCAVVVEVFKQKQTNVPKTSAQLYRSLLQTLLIRYMQETPPYMALRPSLVSIEQLPEEVHKQLMQLCELAYNGVMQNQLIFTAIPTDHLGLMDIVPELYVDTGVKCSYNFLHLTLQEFLAAHHLYAIFKASFRNLSDIFEEHKNHPQVLIFLAGLTKLQSFDQDILKSNLYIAKSSKLLCTIHWLFEAQDQELIESILNEGTVKFRPRYTPTPFDCHSLGYCIAHSSCQWHIDLSDCGLHDDRLSMLVQGAMICPVTKYNVTILDLRNNQMTNDGLKALGNTGTPFLRGIRELDISRNSFDAKTCAILAADLVQDMPNLDNICLSLNTLGPGSAVPFLQKLYTLPYLRELGMYDTGIGYDDIKVICEKLPAMYSIDLLDVGNNQLSPDSVGLIVDTLLSCIPLKRLSMSYTALSGHQVSMLAKVLRVNHNLQGLYLQGCGVFPQGACELAAALCEPDCTLQILSLNENNIGHAGGKAMAEVVAVNTSLRELRLGKADIGKEATLSILENHSKHTKTNIKCIQLSQKYKPEVISTTIHLSWQ